MASTGVVGWEESEQKEFLKAIRQPLLVQTPLQVRRLLPLGAGWRSHAADDTTMRPRRMGGARTCAPATSSHACALATPQLVIEGLFTRLQSQSSLLSQLKDKVGFRAGHSRKHARRVHAVTLHAVLGHGCLNFSLWCCKLHANNKNPGPGQEVR